MTERFRFLIFLAIFCAFLLPSFVLAQASEPGLVVCGNTPDNPCDFEKLIEQVQVVLDFLIFKIASPLAAVMFAYAGYLYVTNMGNESKIKEAHEIFWNVFLGLTMALAAWLVVNFILVFFLGASSPFNFLTSPPTSPP